MEIALTDKRLKHGFSSHKKRSKEYRCWLAMKARCLNKNHQSYKYYGGRGLEICRQWVASFDSFLKDMGLAPSEKHSLDRMDVNGNYEPSNCRWATKVEQSSNMRNNKRLIYNGRNLTISEWSRLLNVSHGTIRYRCAMGWPVDKILTNSK